MPILEPPVATTTAVVATESEATSKLAIKTTPVTAATTLTPVSATPVVTTVVPVTTTPSPTTKAELTTGICHNTSIHSSNFSEAINISYQLELPLLVVIEIFISLLSE